MLLESNSLLGDIIQLLGRLVVLRGGRVLLFNVVASFRLSPNISNVVLVFMLQYKTKNTQKAQKICPLWVSYKLMIS